MKMNKGEFLVRCIAGESLLDPAELMDDSNFVKEIKKLIKQNLELNEIKNKMINWCQRNY